MENLKRKFNEYICNSTVYNESESTEVFRQNYPSPKNRVDYETIFILDPRVIILRKQF